MYTCKYVYNINLLVYCNIATSIILCHKIYSAMIFSTYFLIGFIDLFFIFAVNNALMELKGTQNLEKYKKFKTI